MKPHFLLPGLTLLALLWLLPLNAWIQPFPAHMLRHMGLVAVAAPLLVLGVPRLAARLALPPVPAAAIEFLVVWGWHLPLSHALGRGGLPGFALEQASFLAAGLLVWAGCLAAAQPLAGALGLLLTSMHMTLLGALLVLAPRDLYAEICGTPPDLSGQQLGGMLMLAIGGPVYLLAGLALTARGLARRPAA
ncbi:cytochrome c oxidase assembly protein [Pararhodobacter sp.]|uniref:cytochrome c oxidase assembly protein n=1 Tax=Pararhodobacter sp. TaxID=2127056 RepID=UPI002FE182D7|nr:cytochrome c oxidase assembly protein [Pseudomonadota bacterium]